jgi:DNA-directed RNA polymerase subunit RPC12/RpoP
MTDMLRRHQRAFNDLCTGNEALLRLAGTGICTACGKHVDVDAITEWIDDRSTLAVATDETIHNTAVCPHCGADAMIPDASAKLVAALHSIWF